VGRGEGGGVTIRVRAGKKGVEGAENGASKNSSLQLGFHMSQFGKRWVSREGKKYSLEM